MIMMKTKPIGNSSEIIQKMFIFKHTKKMKK